MSDDDAGIRDLQKRARAAAPADATTMHLEEASLARLRSGDEDESLDAAYRHVASCAVCRARLTDAAPGKALMDAAMPSATVASSPIPIGSARKPARARSFVWMMAAAAMIGVIALLLWRTPRKDAPLLVTQRSFVGTMGTSSSSAVVPPSDRNVELTLESDAETAVVVMCDGASGVRIQSARPFVRDARGKLTVVLAPRLFGPLTHPPGEARAWIFAGSESGVQRVLTTLAPDAAFAEAHVRAVADENDVRLSIVTLAP